jgi:hypothetical protein
MFPLRSRSIDASKFFRWTYVTSAIGFAGLLNYFFMLFASRNLKLEQFNELVFLFSIPTALAMVVSPIGATILSSKSQDNKEKTRIPIEKFLWLVFRFIVFCTLLLLLILLVSGRITMQTFIVSIIWLPILFLMSFGTSLIQLQKRFIYFAAFPVCAAGLKLVALRIALELDGSALGIVVMIQIGVAALATIQFRISSGLKGRYVDFSKSHFLSILSALFLVSVLLSGEVFASRFFLSNAELYVISLGVVLGKLSYIFSVPLVDLALADLYSENSLIGKKLIVVKTIKMMLVTSLLATAVVFLVRGKFYQFINVENDFIPVEILILFLINGFFGATLQLMVHYSISIKRSILRQSLVTLSASGFICFAFISRDESGVLLSVSICILAFIAVLSVPMIFRFQEDLVEK